MKYCVNCGVAQPDEALFCTHCGNKFPTVPEGSVPEKPVVEKPAVPEVPPVEPPVKPRVKPREETFVREKSSSGKTEQPEKPERPEQPEKPDQPGQTGQKEQDDSFLNRVYDYLGSDKDVKIDWRVLFSDVLKEHTSEEAERIFICGTSTTTPDPSEVSTNFPRPWLYGRIFLLLAATFASLWFCSAALGNLNTLPGTMVVGSFIVPLSTVMLFFEINVWRNISFYNVLKTFMIGGCASVVATLILFNLVSVEELDYVGAFLVGLVEEVGKAVIVFSYIRRLKHPTILNGLLYGACVGAGFAAFESAGYAFTGLMSSGFDGMIQSIFLRGFLAPGGHVAWAAVSGAAIVLATKQMKRVTLSTTATNPVFLRLFVLPVAMHALWDCPLASAILPEIFGFHIGLIVCVWFILLVLINMGLKEIPSVSRKLNKPCI